jgi:hypothetical protein
MKFTILEEYNTISEEQVVQFLSTDFSEAMHSQPIYRGMEGSGFYIIAPDKNNPRPSANTYNYYTLIINNSEPWKQFPDREIICSTSSRTSQSYGNVFRIFPKNGAKIGVCPDNDIWGSDFESYNNALHDLFKGGDITELTEFENLEKNYQTFLKACEWIDKDRNEGAEFEFQTYGVIQVFGDYLKGKAKLIDYLSTEVFSPKKFKVMPIATFQAAANKEVWTDATCLAIPTHLVSRMYYKVEEARR